MGYANLALVELLRRRATEIFCIDASGDTPPLAGALGEAMALAYEELGVRIVLDDPRQLVPGGGDPLDPSGPLSELNGRLSRSAVLRGTVHYPAESGLPKDDRIGTIVFAKAVLTGDLPYELLTYAAQHPVFPHDSTHRVRSAETEERTMRAMTCRQLGGPCGIELRGDTADDVIKLQDRHLREAVRGGDASHEPAHEEMKARWRHLVRSMGWYRATKKAFADLSQA